MEGVGGPGAHLGSWGEQWAAEYLERLGWQVVARNWRCPIGELDIVALDPVTQAEPVAVAVEVKCRAGDGFGDPLEAITAGKLARLRRLAVAWKQQSGLRTGGLRVDAIGIVKVRGAGPQLRHVKGVA